MAEEKTQEQQDQQTEKSPYTVTITEAGACKKKISVEIPEEKIRKALDGKYTGLKKDAVLPGFRKGRAPLRLLEKRFGTDITKQVKLQLLADAAQEAVKSNKLDILGDPDIDPEKVELPQSGPMKFEFEVEVRPEFELPELEGIEIKKSAIEITDRRVEEELTSIRNRAGLWAPKDGTVEPEDQIIADIVIATEESNEHDKQDNIEIYVRKTGFTGPIPVEDLQGLLVGAKSGDTKKTSVDVPATFFNEQYRGKKVSLEITVKEIKRLQPAEMNEDFLARFNVSGADELRDNIRKAMAAHAERDARSAMSEQVHQYLREKTSFDLPSDVVADQSLSILQRQYSNMLMQGLAREQIDEQMEQLRAGSEEQARQQLHQFFIMDKIAEKFEITVTDEEVNGYIAQVAAMRGRRPERMREELARDGSLAHFTQQVRQQKCIEKILEKAKITDAEPEKKSAPEKKAATKKKSEPKKERPKRTKKQAEKEG